MSQSDAFQLLDRKLQKWIWQEGWDSLHDIQEQAIPKIIKCEKDVIIASATASGKTEAALLPILTNALKSKSSGIFTIYIAPLKALINDQFRRITDISREIDLKVTPWHGDIGQSKKKKLIKEPSGILLITPESLESIFVNHGTSITRLFESLNYIVIDELHSFIGNERGRHLLSLINRIELIVKRKVVRVGLSATIGDRELAKKFLRENCIHNIQYIPTDESNSFTSDLRLKLYGYKNLKPALGAETSEEVFGFAPQEIANHIFKSLRGYDNLIFTNRRMDVELYADKLRQLSEQHHVDNEFWPHHGSLSKELRETIEKELKEDSKNRTAVCTTTLEMGIDIGSVESIAQIGAPHSVASMRQRLGRSGRRGNPAVLRVYIQEDEITDSTPPQDQLRTELVQTIAMVNLLVDKWYEPPNLDRLHLSTLIQQLLSLIAQYGGVRAIEAWTILCENGPFKGITKNKFVELLKNLGKEDIIIQTDDNTLTFGLTGERIVSHYTFYAAFNTPDEYQIIADGKNLGTLPIEFPLIEGIHIIFAGKRWQVVSVDQNKKIVELKHSKGGKPPNFGGSGGEIHDRIREEMFIIYQDRYVPSYLNKTAKELLEEGRKYFQYKNLKNNCFINDGDDCLFFIWKGSKIHNTVMLLLLSKGKSVSLENVALRIKDTNKEELLELIRKVLNSKTPSALDLVKDVQNKEREKYDYLLSKQLLDLEFSSRFVSVDKGIDFLRSICNKM